MKLAVGIDDVDHLAAVQRRRREQAAADGLPAISRHVTRNFPRRSDEVLAGGSMYWVIKGTMLVRQRIVGLERATGPDGVPRCAVLFDPELVPTAPRPCRAFQGWRYLDPADAPPDFDRRGEIDADMPSELREELRALGLL